MSLSYAEVATWLRQQVPLLEEDVARYAAMILQNEDERSIERLRLCYYVNKDSSLFTQLTDWYAPWRPENTAASCCSRFGC